MISCAAPILRAARTSMSRSSRGFEQNRVSARSSLARHTVVSLRSLSANALSLPLRLKFSSPLARHSITALRGVMSLDPLLNVFHLLYLREYRLQVSFNGPLKGYGGHSAA